MQGVAKNRRDEIRERRLELLVVEATQLEPELPVGAEPRQRAADVCVDRKYSAAKRVHHDAVRALPVQLGEGAE
jgi:hypothetical protein